MFTGLVRERAKVTAFYNNILRLQADHRPQIGDSIAVNGACLTVIALGRGTFDVELADETRAVIAVENLKDEVHIEPAMRMGDRFEGHIVQGHIDTVGTVASITRLTNGTEFYITLPARFLPYLVPKGSVTVDGVSLTVNRVDSGGFYLTLIPHTMRHTLFGRYQISRRVNIETDLFARYVARLLQSFSASSPSLSWEAIEKIQSLY